MSCLLVGTHSRTCADLSALTSIMPAVSDRTAVMAGGYGYADVTTEVLPVVDDNPSVSWTRVIEASEGNAEGRNRRSRVPAWAMVSLVVGAALMAIGMVLRDPVARMVFEAIPR